jgi:hypothetical protein
VYAGVSVIGSLVRQEVIMRPRQRACAAGIFVLCVGICAAFTTCEKEGGPPPECDQDSPAGTCFMDCTGSSVCSERTIPCPEGLDCLLHCEGRDACDTTNVECPATEACTIECEGVDACGDMDLRCGAGDCTMVCGVDPLSCEGATIRCGTGNCSATCDGSEPPTLFNCDTAASCNGC